MNKEEKSLKIEELVRRFSENNNYYFTDASGLTVAEMVSFRKLCYERGVDYKVFKNSLIKKALHRLATGADTWDRQILKGFTGIIFSRENGSVPARLLLDFRKKGSQKPLLKAALIDKELYVGDKCLNDLIKIKSKMELIGEIIGLLQSPARNVISALQSSQNKLAGIVKTLSDKKE
ncbi:MAG TPA: 50S ribosomal protein L10 [Cyclobacteriaceae bacterium]|nr:50S ribosomal protein L10 [Cyclobacteriaceae bacterium]